MSLAKIFWPLYDRISHDFIGIAEVLFGLPNAWIGWIFMALSLGIYIVIGIITRTSNPDQYVAGAGCHRYLTAWPPAQTGCRQRPLSPWRARYPPQGFAGLPM